ncbi:MAG: histidinol dehydrogenase [Gemmatimonadales bacterium]
MTNVMMKYTGRLEELSQNERRTLLDRSRPADEEVRTRVRAIVAAVRSQGDVAVRRFTREFDKVEPQGTVVPAERLREALGRLPQSVEAALRRAARNIEAFHRAAAPRAFEVETEPGVRLRRVPHPVQRVGVYVPGGRAAYPSSVLMGVIPARVVGCPTVVIASPPGADGVPADPVLAAAAIVGVDRVYAVGGAQGIAALAYGTETIEPVDRIVGPGNAYVTEAKLAVANRVGIDGPAGPSELLVLVDATSPLESVAAEMVAQAEHDPDSAIVAVVLGPEALAARLRSVAAAVVAATPREAIVRSALAAQGGLLWTEDENAAVEFANAYAAEHLLVAIDEPDRLAARITLAGALFIGAASSVSFGDYLSGGNHVLPTGGLARSFSGLGSETFVRWVTEQRIDRAGAAGLARDTALLATVEGFPGHRTAAQQWQIEERAR